MVKVKAHLKGFFICLLLLLSGCGTVRIPITVTHPAEINMSSYKQIAISEIKGDLGERFSDEIKNKLVEGGRFDVVERRRLRQIMEELNLSQSDLVDSKNRAKLGKLMGASALIAGKVKSEYDEQLKSEKSTCKRTIKYKVNGKEYTRDESYTCYKRSRTGRLVLTGGVDVIDVETGRIIKNKKMDCSERETNRATDSSPSRIDVDGLKKKCISKVATTFVKAVQPWNETVRVPFRKDKKIPDLERGINQAKMGEMQEAAKIFSTAAKAAESNAGLTSKNIANAYWNLGLAYEYTWEFDRSIEALKKAYSLNPEELYLREIKNVEKMEAERKKLEEQGA